MNLTKQNIMTTEKLIEKHYDCIAILEIIKMAEMNKGHYLKSLEPASKRCYLKDYCDRLVHRIDILDRSIERLKSRYNKILLIK
jgi:hypothetical protein